MMADFKELLRQYDHKKKYNQQQVDILKAEATRKTVVPEETKKKNPIMKTIGTIEDATKDVFKGIAGMVEGVVDTTAGVIASGFDLFGADKVSGEMQKFIATDYATKMADDPFLLLDIFGAYDNPDNFLSKSKTWYDELRKDTYWDELDQMTGGISSGVAEGLGQFIGIFAGGNMLGNASKLAKFGAGTFAFGGKSIEGALNEGADIKQATAYGLASGATETIIESISAGAQKGISKGVGDKITNKILSKVTNNIAKTGIKIAVDASWEGLEEVASEFIDPYLKRFFYDKEAENATSEEYFTAFVSGALVSAIAGGGQVAFAGGATNFVANENYNNLRNEIIDLQTSLENGKINITQYNENRKDILARMDTLTLDMSEKQKNRFENKGLGEDYTRTDDVTLLSSEAFTGEAIEKRNLRDVKKLIKEKYNVDISEKADLKSKNYLNASAFIDFSEGSKIYIDKNSSQKISKTVHELVHQAKHANNELFTTLQEQATKYLTQEEKQKIFNFMVNDIDYSKQFETYKTREEKQAYVDEEITARAIEKALGNKKSLDLLVKGNQGLFNKLLGKLKTITGNSEHRLVGTLNKALLDAKDTVKEKRVALSKDIKEDVKKDTKEDKPRITKASNAYVVEGKRYLANQLTVETAVSNEMADVIQKDLVQYHIKTNKETVKQVIDKLKNVNNVVIEVETIIEEMRKDTKRYNEVDFLYMDSLILTLDKMNLYDMGRELAVEKALILKSYGQAIQINSVINKIYGKSIKISVYERLAQKENKKYEKEKVKSKEIKRRMENYLKGDINYLKDYNLKVAQEKFNIKLSENTIKSILDIQSGKGDFLFKDLDTNELRSVRKRIENIIKKEKPNFENVSVFAKDFTTRMINEETKLIESYNKDRIVISKELLDKALNETNEKKAKEYSDALFKEINEQNVATLFEKAEAFRMMSMLANFKTHFRNIVGNTLMRQVVKIKNTIKAGLEKKLVSSNENSKWYSRYKTSTVKFDKKLYSQVEKQIFQDDLFVEGSKYHENNIEKKIFNTKFIEWIRKFNYNMLSLEDARDCKIMFNYTFTKWMLANNYTMEQINADEQLKADGMQYAIEEANRATFKESSKLANKLNDIQAMNRISKVLVSAVIPFKKTPINIAKQGLRYSPLGLVKSLTLDLSNLNKGKINVNEFCDNVSMGLTGSLITAMGVFLARIGLLRIGKDDDKEYKYNDYIGNQQYSLVIGNHSFTMDWVSPSALPLFTGVALFENFQDNENLIDTISNSLFSMFDPLTEMTMLSGIDRVLKDYSDNKVLGTLKQATQNYVSSFIPTMFGQVAKTIDPMRRDTTATNNNPINGKTVTKYWNTLVAKVPALSMTLEPYIDVWGNETKNYNGFLTGFANAFENTISPTYWSISKPTEVDKEIQRIYMLNGDGKLIPNTPNSYYTVNGQRIDLTAKEYTLYKKKIGSNRFKALEYLINSNSYNNLTDEEKYKLIIDTYNNIDDYSKDTNKKYKENEQFFNSVFELNAYYLVLRNAEGGKEEKVKLVNSFKGLTKVQRKKLLGMLGYKTK